MHDAIIDFLRHRCARMTFDDDMALTHEDLGDGICAIDIGLERPRFGACYLIEAGGDAAIFDAGTNFTVPRILATLAAHGIGRARVRYLIASHVHLDHAGGIGKLLEDLPNARVLAHPRGVRHLLDPTALQASAEEVYGVDGVAQTYGRLVPVPPDRIAALGDDEVVDLCGRPLRFMDSPGHARHHVTMFDERSMSWFTGDCFGISYRDFDGGSAPFIFPTTSPTQFDHAAMKTTIEHMLARRPRAMLLTHYGRLGQPAERAQDLLRLLDAQVALAQRHAGAANAVADLTEALQRLWRAELDRLGAPVDDRRARELLAIDAELNAKGMLLVLGQRQRSQSR